MQCTEYYTTKNKRCESKVKTPSNLFCAHGCWKHTKGQNIFKCGLHTLQKCWYECVVCQNVTKYDPWLDAVMIQLENGSDFYCNKKCFNKNDGFKAENKLTAYNCVMCNSRVFSVSDQALCINHSKHYPKLKQGQTYIKCKYSEITNLFCNAKGWVEKKGDEYWCDEHVLHKENYLKGYVGKSCKYNQIGGRCYKSRLMAPDQDFWCSEHMDAKTKHETDNMVMKQCKYNNLFKGHSTWCHNNGWIKSDENFWCNNHLKIKEQWDNGKRLKWCAFKKLLDHCDFKCPHHDWVDENELFWCPRHQLEKSEHSKGLVPKYCEYDNDLQTAHKIVYHGMEFCHSYKWIEKDKWWICPSHEKHKPMYENGKHLHVCKGKNVHFTEKRCGKLLWTDDFCQTHKVSPKGIDGYISNLLKENAKLKSQLAALQK